MNQRLGYERDEAAFPADAYATCGYRGIAWRVMGWETEPDEDTEWSGYESRTGKVVCIMVGDDRRFSFDRDEVTPLKREAWCGECGQTGCAHDGYDRSEEDTR